MRAPDPPAGARASMPAGTTRRASRTGPARARWSRPTAACRAHFASVKRAGRACSDTQASVAIAKTEDDTYRHRRQLFDLSRVPTRRRQRRSRGRRRRTRGAGRRPAGAGRAEICAPRARPGRRGRPPLARARTRPSPPPRRMVPRRGCAEINTATARCGSKELRYIRLSSPTYCPAGVRLADAARQRVDPRRRATRH